MEISKGLAKIDFKKFDLTKNSILLELFGQLQDYCSDTDENLTQFKKLRMIVTQVNVFKELTESNDHSTTIMALIRKIETLGLDSDTAKWAVKLVADALKIKNKISYGTSSVNTNVVQAPVKKIAKPSKPATSFKKTISPKPRATQSSPAYVNPTNTVKRTSVTPKTNYVTKAPTYKTSIITNKPVFYLISGIISILLAIGGLVLQIFFPIGGTALIITYSILVVASILFAGFSAYDVEEEASLIHAVATIVYIYTLLLIFGFGFVLSGLLMISVFIFLVGLAMMIEDVDFKSWAVTLLSLILLNTSLIGVNLLPGIVPFVSTSVLAIISGISSSVAFNDYEEGYGALNSLYFFGLLVQFVFLFL